MSSNVSPPNAAAGTVARQREPIKAIPVRHFGRWVSAAIVLALVASLSYALATNDNIQWSIVGENLFDGTIMEGLFVTIWLTVLSMLLGVALGVVLAVMRLSNNKVLSTVSWFYIWLFRGTPVLVQLLVWFNLALFFPRIGVGDVSADTNQQIGRAHV